jgi:hypothetical protein
VVIRYIFPRFDILCQEKSGNPTEDLKCHLEIDVTDWRVSAVPHRGFIPDGGASALVRFLQCLAL